MKEMEERVPNSPIHYLYMHHSHSKRVPETASKKFHTGKHVCYPEELWHGARHFTTTSGVFCTAFCLFNCWHGVNPKHFKIMFPAAFPKYIIDLLINNSNI